ncbi:mannosylglucosyl-3-phosphoglycerate phosphatase-like [Asterias amurensis]|uniref:mannosylglucosyl-3-phosphoglycerate phosphatase-like n=1 Tax=Asterias amurensis TaxID=7602 RepID=UPI003AB5846D
MGSTCSLRSTAVKDQEQEVARWRGHILYGNGLDDSTPNLSRKSSYQRKLSAEIKAMYTTHATVTITILHFNDVYNVEPKDREPVGGAARFATIIKSFLPENPLVFFSGDALNPSIMSNITRGQHMVPVLNAMKVNTAVYGNHDFDFGVDELEDIVRDTNFPWMMSNVIDNFTGQPLADGLVTRTITCQGKKIGLIGLVEEEWLVTLATIDRENLTYIDYVTQGNKLARVLRQQGADYVIALTHMRMPNDIRLAENVEDIDLILGGHDHDYEVIEKNGTYIVKSGSDFRTLSRLEVTFTDFDRTSVKVEKIDITSEIEEDSEVKEIVSDYQKIINKELEDKLGTLEVDLDARFALIRTQETNIGNFVTDIMLATSNADIALLNSGTFRSDTIHQAGDFKKRDLMCLLPMIDVLVVLQITGVQLWQTLENGVSQHPKKEGRFPQVSGIKFGFDPNAEPGCRIDPYSISIGDQPISPSKVYRLCTKDYIAQGKDGYDTLRVCRQLSSAEEGPVLSTVVQNHFLSINIVKGLKPCHSGHRQSLISLSRRHSLLRQANLDLAERAQCTVDPAVEGRIFHLPDEQRPLVKERQSQFLQAYKEEVEMQLTNNNNSQMCQTAEDSYPQTLSNRIPEVIVSDATFSSPSPDDDGDDDDEIASPSSSFVSIFDDEDMRCLWGAVQKDDLAQVKRLHIDQCVSLGFKYRQTSALHEAVHHDAMSVAEYLLQEAKIDPDIRDEISQNTPLMLAVMDNNHRMAQLLLQNSATLHLANQEGMCAKDFLPENSSSQLKSLLKDQDSNSVHQAASNGGML